MVDAAGFDLVFYLLPLCSFTTIYQVIFEGSL